LKSAVLPTVAFVLLLGLVAWFVRPRSNSERTHQFRTVVDRADRIVVRHGVYPWRPEVLDTYPVLFEVRNIDQVDEVRRRIAFERDQEGGACGCMGYPVIVWYRGDTRIAIMSVQHGQAIRWNGFKGDGDLTGESRKWVIQWLVRNGVPRAMLR
jgi:hypothetical protein